MDHSNLRDALQQQSLDRGVIRIDGELEECQTAYLFYQLEYVFSLENLEKVTIYLNSPGGSVYSALAMYDLLLRGPTIPITIICEGRVASAASMILLQAGTTRLSLPHTQFILHELGRSSFSFERSSELSDSAAVMKALTKVVMEILSKRCNKSCEDILKEIERKEVYLSATEAKNWGLIDGIIGGEGE